MHDRAVVVGADLVGALALLEPLLVARADLVPRDGDVSVPGGAGLLVVEARRVADLVNDAALAAARDADLL